MLRKFTLLLTALAALAAVLFTGGAASADPGDGDNRPCVTAREWNKVHDGMGMGQVHQIFDTRGFLHYGALNWDWSEDSFRVYKPCAGFGNRQGLVVWYDNYSNGNSFHVWDKYRSTNPALRF